MELFHDTQSYDKSISDSIVPTAGQVVIALLVNYKYTLLVPEAKPRPSYNISYYHFNTADVFNYLIKVVIEHLEKLLCQ